MAFKLEQLTKWQWFEAFYLSDHGQAECLADLICHHPVTKSLRSYLADTINGSCQLSKNSPSKLQLSPQQRLNAATKLYNELALLNEKVAVQLPELLQKHSRAQIDARLNQDQAMLTSRVADEYKVEPQVIQRAYDDLCSRLIACPYRPE